MATYLLTWNPDKYQWDYIDDAIKKLKRSGVFKGRWSCGICKSIKKGDRLFLMKLGRKTPKGICASGYAVSNVYEDKHWAGTKGKKANYVDIDFDIILNPDTNDILKLEKLRQIKSNSVQQWAPQQSGIIIKPEIANTLERKWLDFINKNKRIREYYFKGYPLSHRIQEFIEGDPYQTTLTMYERNPYARRVCIQHYGTSCIVCGFSFQDKYGSFGRGFIHIHHLAPISKTKRQYKLDPIADLRPVCPNCHAMIHKRKPPLSIEELKEKIISSA